MQFATASYAAVYDCVWYGLQAVGGGSVHTCGIVASTAHLLCWGYDSHAQTVVPVDSGGNQYEWQVCTKSVVHPITHRPNPAC